MRRNLEVYALIVFTGLYSAGPVRAQEQAEQTGDRQVEAAARQDLSYEIGPNDILSIAVAGMPELETRATVNELGVIRMELIGEITAAGLTTRELEQTLAEALTRFVTNPQVVVQVVRYQSQSYFLYGAVRQTGSFPISGRISLLEALVSAGGLLEEEARGPIRIIRKSFGREPLEIDGQALFFDGNRAYDIDLEPGDMINVLRKPEYNIYIYHQGGSGGAYTFRDPVSLLQAVSLIGGLGEGASDKLKIVRTLPDGTKEQIEVDFGDILDGKLDDVPLMPNDVVIIKGGGIFG